MIFITTLTKKSKCYTQQKDNKYATESGEVTKSIDVDHNRSASKRLCAMIYANCSDACPLNRYLLNDITDHVKISYTLINGLLM